MARLGRYNKKFFEARDTQSWAQSFLPRIQTPLTQLTQSQITPAEFCALYIELFLIDRFGSHSHSSKLPKGLLQLKNESSTLSSWATLGFRGIKLATNRSLIEWQNQNYPLTLYFNIPKPSEILKLQAFGKRCVSALITLDQIPAFSQLDRDPVSFLIHDLIHADQFFFKNQAYLAQRVLCYLFYCLYEEAHWNVYFTYSPKLESQLNYIFSDMNSHPIHILKVLKSCLEKTPFWQSTQEALNRVMDPQNSWMDPFSLLNTKFETNQIHLEIFKKLSESFSFYFE